MSSTVPSKLLQFIALVIFFLHQNGAEELPPFCSICDCKLDYTNYYKINCTTDIHQYLFQENYWIDKTGKEYPYRTLNVEKSAIFSIDRQFPKSPITALFMKDCSIDYISDSTFSNLLYLEKLVLSHNEIKGFHPKTFVGPYQQPTGHGFLPLQQLLLDHNKIETLSREVFKYSRDIKILSLAHNPLETLDFQTNKAISGLASLRKLDLSNTQLSSLPSNFLQFVENLRFLDLSGNRFVAVPENLPNVPSLQFGGNPIVTLSHFPNVTSLRVLNLCQMPLLEEIGEGCFQNLVQLEEVHLCDNRELKSIHKDAFLKVNGHRRIWLPVKKLYVQNSGLSSIDMELLEWDDLEALDLSNNPWTCDCTNRWTIYDLFPNVVLKLGEGEDLRCAAPSSVANLHFADVYKNNKMATCWTFHKKVKHWIYDLFQGWSLREYFVSFLIFATPYSVFWYMHRNRN